MGKDICDMRGHAGAICRVLTSIDPTKGAEIGIGQGTTSSRLLRTFPKLILYMVDPWEEESSLEATPSLKDWYVKAHYSSLNLTEFAKDRRIVIQARSEVAVKQVGDESIDFVFIDGNHWYDFVKQDIELWFPKVRCGGIVSGHDYDGRGDRKYKWGVKKAVDEFAERKGYVVSQAHTEVWWFQK